MLSSDPPSELAIDPDLGYPPAFANLCSHPLFSLSLSPAHHSSFLPYPLSPKQLATCKGLDALFPAMAQSGNNDGETMAALRRNHAAFLWRQLNHLGNAGFDPAEFRIDVYGNVLQWAAPSSSPLAWDVDHWFPVSRGGKTVVGNLRLIQWQVRQQKGEQLEFLMPWWDFQLGVSVTQFLLIFASRNADFRHRAFSWLFHNPENSDAAAATHQCHRHEIKHSWPPQFKRSAEQHGFAAAAIVNLSDIKSKPQPPCPDAAYEAEKEDGGRKMIAQQQQQQQHQQEELSAMEKDLKMIKQRNERESVALGELESTLARHKKQLEKQRLWSEMQSQYRHCLERVIRDTLHQNFIYREQMRLNRAACGALLAKIQSHKLSAEDVEINLVKQLKHREALEELAMQPESELSDHANLLKEENGLDIGIQSCFIYSDSVGSKGPGAGDERKGNYNNHDDKKHHPIERSAKRTADVCGIDASSKPPMDTIMEEEDCAEEAQLGGESQSISPLKRKVGSDPDAGHGYKQRQRIGADNHIASRFHGRDESLSDVKVSQVKVRRDGQQLEEVLQEALTLKSSYNGEAAKGDGDANGFLVVPGDDAETEEQRANRLGKSNVEKWLQQLLSSHSSSDHQALPDSNRDGRRLSDVGAGSTRKDRFAADERPKHDEELHDPRHHELEKPKKVLDGLLRMVSFRHDQHGRRKAKALSSSSKERTNTDHDDGSSLCHEVREIHCMPENVQACVDSSKICNDGFCDVIPASDVEFAKKMRDVKEEERKKRSCASRTSHWSDWESKEGNPDLMNTASFSSEAPRQDKLKRSFSMRAPTMRSNMVASSHTRRGSDMLSSSWSSSSSIVAEEGDYDSIQSMLQPSWSVKDAGDDRNEDRNNKTSMNLKASLRTCTKAWKHAVHKRKSSSKS